MGVITFLQDFEKCLLKFFNITIDMITEQLIVENSLLITEIYNESVVNGLIQTTDYEVLKMFVQLNNQKISRKQLNQQQVTIQATKQLSYRNPGLSYKVNKLDVLIREKLYLICNNIQTISGHIEGQIIVDNQLSGMPDVTLQLNTGSIQQKINSVNNVQVENVKNNVLISQLMFHQCVKSDKQDVITFIPPDGRFLLGKYQVGNDIINPFQCKVILGKVTKNTINAILSIQTNYSQNIIGEDIAVKIPIPQGMIKYELETDKGKSRINKQGTFIDWAIGDLPGKQKCQLRFMIQTQFNPLSPQDLRQEKRKNIWMKFKINNYTSSGINLLSAQVLTQLNYQTEKRYGCILESDQYQIQW